MSTSPTSILDRLDALVSPYGVMASVHERAKHRGLDRLSGYTSVLGSAIPGRGMPSARGQRPNASGQAVDDPDLARLIAIAEGAERYSSACAPMGEVITAPPRMVHQPALDVARIPVCSKKELSTGFGLPRPDPDSEIRWVLGVDLGTGQPTWVPAVMACYGIRDFWPAEQFWYRISTGCAVHTDPAEALVRGICEVVERDMIAIMWLQMLPLPRVRDAYLSPEVEDLLDWGQRHYLDSYLFDATSEIGVPTVYCLQIAQHEERARQVVGCATARTMAAAAQKALLEAIGFRHLCYSDEPLPADFSEFTAIDDGARYMAMSGRAGAFDFLLNAVDDRARPERKPLPDDPLAALAWLIESLSHHNMQVLAVNRTPPEIAAAGLTAVSVVIPDLQPMTLLPLAQFRAHPRLYRAPEQMGYPARTEEDLSPWPQPFA